MAKKRSNSPQQNNRINEVLEDQEKTQMWLAEQLDRDFKTVTRYVHNQRQPTIETLFEIAKVLKVSPRDLLKS
jgi:transcriptional regulator with XRE-family HTH domain